MKTHSTPSLSLILLILISALCASALQAQSVTVQPLNLSDAPPGPLLVATHPSGLSPLFNPAAAPSADLQMFSLGTPALLEAEARDLAAGHPHVRFGSTAGPGPGQSVTAEIPVTPCHRRVSLAAPLAPSGFAGFHNLPALPGAAARYDELAWEAAGIPLARRSPSSPIARAWIRYHRPPARHVLRAAPPQLTQLQAAGRAACLQDSATCIRRLEGGQGLCADCLPPLRPNAARTHCVE